MIDRDKIPAALRGRPQWIVWRNETRGDKPTKVPYQTSGQHASSTDPQTWTTFDKAFARFQQGGYDGIGYVFAQDDPFCGIDLDGCRDEGGGREWARQIVARFNSYAEVSPSSTGVKIFIEGRLPFSGRKKELPKEEPCGGKSPGIEVYDQARYFAVTGRRVAGPTEPQPRQEVLDAFCKENWPEQSAGGQLTKAWYSPEAVIERARKYLLRIPPAVSGHRGHDVTFRAACILVKGFSLQRNEALQLLTEWSQSCEPPWSQRELEHKVDDAIKTSGEVGYLRIASPDQWRHIAVPNYELPKTPRKIELTTLSDAAQSYIELVRRGGANLVDTGLPDLDGAIGGGVESGEMIVLAARPSHGKSLVALQCAHNWTAEGLPVLFVTEEMSKIALGKRTLQYVSQLPGEHWKHDTKRLELDLEAYKSNRAECFIAENCGTVEIVTETVKRSVDEHGVKAVVIDYAQLLQSPGRSRYEQITHTSGVLRKLANEHKLILLVLCQMSRAIEGRKQFLPVMSDIKETGAFEQDADAVIFIVWPHRIDQKQDAHEFKFYIAKNRNRAINQTVVTCRIEPSRQMLVPPHYVSAFDEWDGRAEIGMTVGEIDYDLPEY